MFAAAIVAVTTLIAVIPYREARASARRRSSLASVARGMRALARDPRLIGVTLTCMILVSVQQTMNAFVTVTGVTMRRRLAGGRRAGVRVRAGRRGRRAGSAGVS